MRDPHIHLEKTVTPGFGNAQMRELIVQAIGVAVDMPKTVGTGCGRRRPIAMTSQLPESITCLACREYGARIWAEHAATAQSLLDLLQNDPELRAGVEVRPEQLTAEMTRAADLAGRFGGMK